MAPSQLLLSSRSVGDIQSLLSITTTHIPVISSSRCNPRQIVSVPGSPSDLRPKNPPNPIAIIRVASRKVGGFCGGRGSLVTKATKAFHWASSKYTVQGTSGTSRPRLVKPDDPPGHHQVDG